MKKITRQYARDRIAEKVMGWHRGLIHTDPFTVERDGWIKDEEYMCDYCQWLPDRNANQRDRMLEAWRLQDEDNRYYMMVYDIHLGKRVVLCGFDSLLCSSGEFNEAATLAVMKWLDGEKYEFED